MELGVSGNFTVTLKNAYNYGTFGIGYVRFYYEEWYDIATNDSEIRIVDIKARQTKYTGSASVNIKAYVDGSDALVSKSMDAKLTSTSSYASVTGVEFPIVIKDADGNGLIKHDDITGEATTTLKFYAKLTVGEFTYNSTSSTTIALTKIPRISDLTVTGEEIGSSLQLNIAAATTDFTHTISYKFGAVSETIMDKSPSNIVFWTAPLSLCSEIPNDDKGECVFTISTYTGEELVGTKTVSVTLLVPDSVKLFVRPDCVTVDHYNTGTNASELAAYVQGYSKAQVSFDKDKIGYGTAYGATIGAFEIAHKGNTYSVAPNEEVTIEQILTAVLADAGEHTVECAVIDTRGKRVTTTLTFLVESYTNPVIVTPKLFRCNAYGVETDDGTYLSVYAKASISSVAGLNQPTMIVTIGELTPEEVPVDQITVIGDANVQSTQTYRATITLTDSLGNTATYFQIIPTADVMFHGRAGGKGAAFGKYAEEDDLLEVAWNQKIKKDLTVEGKVTAGGLAVAAVTVEAITATEAAVENLTVTGETKIEQLTATTVNADEVTTETASATTVNANTLVLAGKVFVPAETIVVWRNADPTSTFATQTIALDLSEHEGDEAEVRCYTNTTNDTVFSEKCEITATGLTTQLRYVWNHTSSSNTLGVRVRTFTPTTTGVKFSDAYGKYAGSSGSTSKTNDYIIPYEIRINKKVISS